MILISKGKLLVHKKLKSCLRIMVYEKFSFSSFNFLGFFLSKFSNKEQIFFL